MVTLDLKFMGPTKLYIASLQMSVPHLQLEAEGGRGVLVERPQQVRSQLTFRAPRGSLESHTTTAAYPSEDISSAGLTKRRPPNTHFIPALLCPSSCFPAAPNLRGCQLICSLWVFRSWKVWYFFFGNSTYFFISMIEDFTYICKSAYINWQ